MAKGATSVSQVRQNMSDNNMADDALHEQHVENIVAKEFNLQEAKKKLRTLQETQVSQKAILAHLRCLGRVQDGQLCRKVSGEHFDG